MRFSSIVITYFYNIYGKYHQDLFIMFSIGFSYSEKIYICKKTIKLINPIVFTKIINLTLLGLGLFLFFDGEFFIHLFF